MELLTNSNSRGFTLIEAMLSLTILVLLGIGGVSANRLATSAVSLNQNRSEANLLAEEAMEALMSVRAHDFLSLSPGVFHPVFDGERWLLVAGEETVGRFRRSITITTAMRELSCFSVVCDVTDQGGISDEGSYRTSVVVKWDEQNEENNIELNSLITYWR